MTSVEGIVKRRDVASEIRTLHGQYVHAFCAGLADALKPYEAQLVEIEKKVRTNRRGRDIATSANLNLVRQLVIWSTSFLIMRKS